MKLLRVELFGFKSFAKRTVIEIDEGITAIVGPNGSGKSNIADAIRWVLGEQSAKAMRGAKMEDVIFSGTQQRKPLGYCEVTLVFENADGRLKIDYTEVSVTRRVYRSGEGEYFINQRQCRLRDIAELFRDTGIGKEGYSIIGQGRVDEILSSKSQERRTLFEEAAGVMRYRVRKEESERKLDNTSKNLIRINDILLELEDRLEPLFGQSESAKKYLRLRDELKASELNLFLIQYEGLNERIEAARLTILQLETEITSAELNERKIAAECKAKEDDERSYGDTLNQLKSALLETASGLEKAIGETKVLDERIYNSLREIDSLRQEINRVIEAERDTQVLLKASIDTTEAFDVDINELKAKIDAEEVALCESSERLMRKEGEIEAQKNAMIEALRRLSGAMSDVSRLNATLEALALRHKEALSRRTTYDDEISRITDEQESLTCDLVKLCEDREKLLAEKNAQANKQSEVVTLYEMKQAEIAASDRLLQQMISRVRVLKELKESHDGYYDSVKNVLKDAKYDRQIATLIEGAVAELMSVPVDFETAIEMSLGAALQNIVTPDEYAAKLIIEHAKKRRYGRVTLLPLTVIKGRTLTSIERQYIDVDGCFGVASELVNFDERYRNIFENLLGRTVIVRDIDVGILINKRAHAAFRIATLNGDIINAGGSMSGGSLQRREFSILGRERETQSLVIKVTQEQKRLDKLRNEVTKINEKRQSIASLMSEISGQVHELDTLIATQREKIDMVSKILDDTMCERESHDAEIERIDDSIKHTKEQLSSIEQTRSGMEQWNELSREEIAQKQQQLTLDRRANEERSKSLTELKIKLTGLTRDHYAKRNEASRLKSEIEANRKLQQDIDLKVKELTVNIDNYKILQAAANKRKEELKISTDTITVEIAHLEKELTLTGEMLSTLRQKHLEVFDYIRILKERKQKAEVGLTRSDVELTSMYDRIWSEYQLTYEGIKPYRREIGAASERITCDKLKREIHELGSVNVNAIDEYSLIKERYDSMKRQSEDLLNAEQDLKRLISELTVSMKAEFKKQFELIRGNFSIVFSKLFHGGHAEIHLTDENDVLNCDIEIVAQPPGKKLQLLSLLSGGERALTAIALLFAILSLKPVSFCVLDEIETSLDEANVSNFAEYLKDYSQNTQFIMITHRKGSMSVANAMYGVAMEEKGISKVVSARFDADNAI